MSESDDPDDAHEIMEVSNTRRIRHDPEDERFLLESLGPNEWNPYGSLDYVTARKLRRLLNRIEDAEEEDDA